MRPDVRADLDEAVHRTRLHLAAKRQPATATVLVGPWTQAEDMVAEPQPTGSSLEWFLAVASGLAITASILWGPRLLRLLWAVTR